MLVPALIEPALISSSCLGKTTQILISSSVCGGSPRDWGDKQGSWDWGHSAGNMISAGTVTQGHSHPCHFARVNSSISFHPLLKQPGGGWVYHGFGDEENRGPEVHRP